MNDILMMDRSKMNMTKHGKQCATSYMLLSTCCIAAVALIAKQSTLIFGLNQAILLRFLLPLLCLGTALMVCRKKINQSRHLKLHSIRACLVTGSEYCLFYYITKTTLLNGALLINTTPIFMTLIAFLSLDKKKPSMTTLLGMAVGFAGILVILQPSTALVQPLMLVGLCAGFLSACSQCINHHLSQTENATMISLHLYALCTLITFSVILFSHVTGLHRTPMTDTLPHLIQLWPWWLCFVVFSFGSQILRSMAYSHVNNACTLAPLLFATVLFSSIIDWVYYHSAPTPHAIIGGLLVLLSTVIGIKGQHSHNATQPESLHARP